MRGVCMCVCSFMRGDKVHSKPSLLKQSESTLHLPLLACWHTTLYVQPQIIIIIIIIITMITKRGHYTDNHCVSSAAFPAADTRWHHASAWDGALRGRTAAVTDRGRRFPCILVQPPSLTFGGVGQLIIYIIYCRKKTKIQTSFSANQCFCLKMSNHTYTHTHTHTFQGKQSECVIIPDNKKSLAVSWTGHAPYWAAQARHISA